MRDHDIELIAALVEGRLDDETEALALIAASAEAREEYETQKLAFESLRALGSANLRETERAALHRDLWTNLRGGDMHAEARSPWYLRWSPVAAGLLVLVGVVAVLSQGGQEAGLFENLAAGGADEAAAPTTAAADAGEDGALFADDADATATTQAMTEGTTDSESAPAEAAQRTVYAADAERVRAGDFSGDRLNAFTAGETDSSTLQTCVDNALAEVGLDDYEIAATVMTAAEEDPPPPSEATTTTTTISATTAPDTPEVAVAIPEGAEPATAPLAFVDVQDCQLVYIDQP